MKTSDLMEMIGLLDDAEDFRPIVKKLIKVLKSYSGEIKEIIEPAVEYLNEKNTDMKLANIAKYENNGFCRDDAILLAIDGQIAIKRLLEKSLLDSKK